MNTPMDRLLDAVKWQELPAPVEEEEGDCYATHQGVLTIGNIELRCYVLNDGRRVIDADDVHAFFGL